MKTVTTARWSSPDVEQHKHTVGHETYNARLLAMVLLKSITDEFMTTLFHRIPTVLRNDGSYLLWAISHNIHRNNVAFHEHIRDKIRTATLASFDNDIDRYIIAIKNFLKMITPATGSTTDKTGLLTYILKQLKLCNVPLFQDYIRKIHVAFQEGDHSTMTPSSLLQQVDDKIRALKHASEWNASVNYQPSAMALMSSTSSTHLELLLKQQNALISKLLHLQQKDGKHGNSYNEWKHTPPTNPDDIRRFNGKIFRWCTKCNNGQGQWASAHDTKTHVDNFRHDRNKQNAGHGAHPKGPHQRNLRRGRALLANQDSQPPDPTPDDGDDTADTTNLASLTANAARVRFAQDMDAGWRFDVSDALED
jgi:hypothetical protein